LFEEYRGFLSEEEFKDERLARALKSIDDRHSMPDNMFDDYLTTHAKTITSKNNLNSDPVYCRLLKLSFCLIKYVKYRFLKWSRKRILNSVNNLNCEKIRSNGSNRNIAYYNRNAWPQTQPPRSRRTFKGFFRAIGFII
jgi:hypothetical protein